MNRDRGWVYPPIQFFDLPAALAGGVAAHAITYIGDPFFLMAGRNIGGSMRVAAVASVACESVGMAGAAAIGIASAVAAWEAVGAVEAGWRPGGGAMARGAIGTE